MTGIKAIADALSVSSSMKKLTIFKNDLGDEGIGIITSAAEGKEILLYDPVAGLLPSSAGNLQPGQDLGDSIILEGEYIFLAWVRVAFKLPHPFCPGGNF